MCVHMCMIGMCMCVCGMCVHMCVVGICGVYVCVHMVSAFALPPPYLCLRHSPCTSCLDSSNNVSVLTEIKMTHIHKHTHL